MRRRGGLGMRQPIWGGSGGSPGGVRRMMWIASCTSVSPELSGSPPSRSTRMGNEIPVPMMSGISVLGSQTDRGSGDGDAPHRGERDLRRAALDLEVSRALDRQRRAALDRDARAGLDRHA